MNETKLIHDAFRAGAVFAMSYLDEEVPLHRIEEECDNWIKKLIREDDEFPED